MDRRDPAHYESGPMSQSALKKIAALRCGGLLSRLAYERGRKEGVRRKFAWLFAESGAIQRCCQRRRRFRNKEGRYSDAGVSQSWRQSAATFRLDEFHSRLSDRPPDQSAWSDRVAAIERHLELTRQVDRIRDLEARAFVGQIAHDTIDDR